MRLARVAERKGWRFPRVSDDEVIQFLVEEALMSRVDLAKLREQEVEHKRSAIRSAQDRAAAAVQRLRRV